MRRSCSTTSPTARRRCCRGCRRSPGRPVPCVNADVRDVAALRAVVPRPSDRGGRALRGPEGRRRIRGAAARLLRRQRRRRDRAGRGDGRGGRGHARVQLVGDRLRAARRPAGDRGRAAAPAQRLRAHQARGRGLPARPGARQRELAHRDPALLQSGRRAFVRDARRGAARAAEQPRAAAVQDRRAASSPNSRSTAATGRRPTAPASATTCTCRTWPRATSRRCRHLPRPPAR